MSKAPLTLTDTDPMPFGAHKNTAMKDVPVEYLNWLWRKGMRQDKHCAVADYIRRNIDDLKSKLTDVMWGKK